MHEYVQLMGVALEALVWQAHRTKNFEETASNEQHKAAMQNLNTLLEERYDNSTKMGLGGGATPKGRLRLLFFAWQTCQFYCTQLRPF